MGIWLEVLGKDVSKALCLYYSQLCDYKVLTITKDWLQNMQQNFQVVYAVNWGEIKWLWYMLQQQFRGDGRQSFYDKWIIIIVVSVWLQVNQFLQTEMSLHTHGQHSQGPAVSYEQGLIL